MSRTRRRRSWTIPALALLSCIEQPDAHQSGTRAWLLEAGRVATQVSPSLRASASLLRKRRSAPAMRGLPIYFEANHGQTAPRFSFVSRRQRYSLHLSAEHVSVLLDMAPRKKSKGRLGSGGPDVDGPSDKAAPVRPPKEIRISLQGARSAAQPIGLEPQPGKVNYFIGRDPAQWKTNIPTYGAVGFEGVYPGIDLIYHARQETLEYDFVVAPGADPSVISVKAHGHERLEVGKNGNLHLRVGDRALLHRRPVAYQLHGQEHRPVEAAFVRRDDGTFGFAIGDYDRSKPLVVDPVLSYATYFGDAGGGPDGGTAIATDAAGAAYVTGFTFGNLPVTTTAGYAGIHDVFVAKLDPTLSNLAWATYIGTPDSDFGNGIAVDGSGRAHVVGTTSRPAMFPVTANALQSSGSDTVGFYSVLSADGTALVYSTLLHSGSSTTPDGIALDSTGAAHISGYTSGAGFPTPVRSGFSMSLAGGFDAFLAVIDIAAANALRYLTLLGGSGYEFSARVAVDPYNRTIVAGYTSSSDFPTTASAAQPSFAGGTYDAYVVKLNTAVAGAASRLWSTYWGGPAGQEYGWGVAADRAGNVLVTGQTNSTNYPVTPLAYQTTKLGAVNSTDVFLLKLSAEGAAVFSTFLGGPLDDYGTRAVAADAHGNVFVGMNTNSLGLGVSACPIQSNPGTGNSQQPYLIALNPSGTARVYGSYLGSGSAGDSLGGIAISGDDVLVTGQTNSATFPVTAGAYDTTPPPLNNHDAYVMRVLAPLGCGDPAVGGPAAGSLAQGALCASGLDCATGNCVDGVCCDFPCGGDSIHDCQSCSVGGGAAQNGTCVTITDGRLCRPAVGPCDVAEACNGTSAACPPDVVATAGTPCRPAVGGCDLAEECDGTNATCPPDAIAAAGAICRASAGSCDPLETCVGGTTYCGPDVNDSTNFIELVSQTTGGAKITASNTNSYSRNRRLSNDGRYALFQDVNGTVFHRDMQAGVTTAVSLTPSGATRAGANAAMSPDGRFVIFESSSNDLVSGDTNGFTDVFVRDLCLGAVGCVPSTQLVSVWGDQSPIQSNFFCSYGAVSAGGRYVTFVCSVYGAWSPVAGLTTPVGNVWWRDTCRGATNCTPETRLVSERPLASGPARFDSSAITPSMDASGRFVVYSSDSINIVDKNGIANVSEIFLADMVNNTTTWLTARTGSAGASSAAPRYPYLTANGRFALYDFASASGSEGLYLYDTCFGAGGGCTPASVQVNIAYDGMAPNPATNQVAQVSEDGRYVVFESPNPAFVPILVSGVASYVFVRDVSAGTIQRISQQNPATPVNGYSPAISGDGKVVAFRSDMNLGFGTGSYAYARGNTNAPPTANTTPPQSATVCGAPLQFSVSAMDTCTTATNLTYYLVGPAAFTSPQSGVSFNSATGTLTMSPVHVPAGTHNVVFAASDGMTLGYFNVQVTINNASGNTWTVTNTNDSGAGSLREAILCANANGGPDIIAFNLSGTAPFTISPTTYLPDVAAGGAVTIDGTTQPGYTTAPLVFLRGNAVSGSSSCGAVLCVRGDGSAIFGLGITNWLIQNVYGVYVRAASVTLQGNYIGVDATGETVETNFGAIALDQTASGALIGGQQPNQGNVLAGGVIGASLIQIGGASTTLAQPILIQGNKLGTNAAGTAFVSSTNAGITVNQIGPVEIGGMAPSAGNTIATFYPINATATAADRRVKILNNYIGTDKTGNNAFSSSTIGVAATGFVTVGAAGAGNVISATGSGVYGSGAGAGSLLIQGNSIGLGANGTTALGAPSGGAVYLGSGTSAVVGGLGAGEANILTNATGPGVSVTSSNSYGNIVRGNHIFGNGGLGIDLGVNGADGVTANDNLDLDTTGGNRFQNYPNIVVLSPPPGTTTTVNGTLNSTPNTTFDIDFYTNTACDTSGYGEGKDYIGATAVTTDASGNVGFTYTPQSFLALGTIVTATATHPVDGTSEISPCATAVVSVPLVNLSDAVAVTEGSPASFTLSLSETPTQAVTVNYTTTDGTASSQSGPLKQYNALAGSWTFPANTTATSKVVTVSTLDNIADQPNGTFQLKITSASNAIVADGEGQGTILDNDNLPTISISDVTQTECDPPQGQTYVFEVTLSSVSGWNVSVNAATQDGTAIAPTDYNALSQTLSWPAGTTNLTQYFAVTGWCNTILDNPPAPQFYVDLTNPVNATIADDQGVGTRIDDERPRLTNPGNKSVAECSSLTFNLSATLGSPPYTFSATGLPPGGTLDPASGVFSYQADLGTTGNNYSVTFSVTDSQGVSDSKTITITVGGVSTSPVTVTNANNTGSGSFNWAIQCINARATGGTINFGIGTGAQEIALNTPLPTITKNAIVDGTTQPGYSAGGAPLVAVKPSVTFTGTPANGLTLTAGATVKALSIGSFPNHGIAATGTAAITIQSCYLGLGPDGSARGNGVDGINLSLSGTATHVIGGTSSSLGNRIASNLGYGIQLNNTSNTQIDNNYIGTNIAGTVAMPNALGGVRIFNGSSNRIGLINRPNVISGNAGYGVRLDGSSGLSNSIYANYIGLDATGVNALPNAAGVLVTQQTSYLIGSLSNGGNVISGNSGAGVRVDAANNSVSFDANKIGTNAAGTALLGNGGPGIEVTNNSTGVFIGVSNGNTIRGNGYLANPTAPGVLVTGASTRAVIRKNNSSANAGLGIDLNGDGVTLNDVGDADTGPNTLVNYPILTLAETTGTTVFVAGTWAGPANTSNTVDIYSNDACDPSGYGEGQSYVGAVSVTTDATGAATFSAALASSVAVGAFLTANVTTPTNNSSELSPCFVTTAESSNRTLIVSNASITEGNSLTKNLGFIVRLNAPKSTAATFNYATADGTATAPSDYTATSGTGTITAGQTSTTVNVVVKGDATYELDETFTLQISNASGATIVGGTATGTITNDDQPPVVAFYFSSRSTTEGNSGPKTLTFPVAVTPAQPVDVIVQYHTQNGTATAGADYVGVTNGSVTIPANTSTPVDINITINGDTDPEPNETLSVILDSATNATVSTNNGTNVGTITNDDLMNVAIADQQVPEGSSGATTPVTITLPAPATAAFCLSYQTAPGTASFVGINQGDYYSYSPQYSCSQYPAYCTVCFNPGNTTKTLDLLYVYGDTTPEPDETFFVNIAWASGASVNITKPQAVITILNDDLPMISVDAPSVTEGNTGLSNLTFTATLNGTSVNQICFDYATDPTDGTASPGTDYQEANGTLCIPAGSTTGTFSVPVLGDTEPEDDETVAVILSNPVNGTLSSTTAYGTINNDDLPGLTIDDPPAVSEAAGVVTFTATLSAPSDQYVCFSYSTADGSAQAGFDYSAVPDLYYYYYYCIYPGSLTQQIPVYLINDATSEATETFFLDLKVYPGYEGTVNVTKGQGVATILDDDVPTISLDSPTIPEAGSGQSDLTFTATLNTTSPYEVCFDYATEAAGGTATSGTDYQATNGTLCIPAGSTTGTFSVPVNGDAAFEPNETVVVTLSNPVNGTLASATASGTIVNDDLPTLTVDNPSVAESAGAITFTATLSPPAVQTHCFYYWTTDVTANDGSDYTGQPTPNYAYFCLYPGESTYNLTFNVSADTVSEGAETFNLQLAVYPGYPQVNMPNPVPTGTIDDGVIANNDVYGVAQDQVLNVAAALGVLSNDAAPAGATLTATVVDTTTHGTLTLESDGGFTYTPMTGYVGPDSFTYQVEGSTGGTAAATVKLVVIGQCLILGVCDAQTGTCTTTPKGTDAECDDGNKCTQTDMCNGAGICVGTPIAVDDNNPCTNDSCDPATGLPMHTSTPGAGCNDNDACTTNDVCDASGQCVGTLIAVDDSNACTSDSCDPATGLSAYTPTPGAACNDNNACTNNDACNANGQCVGTSIAVDDNNPCTNDSCDPATGLPMHTPTPGAACNDNDACTTNDVCNASGQCVGTLIAVDDSNACTSDSCDPATGLPAHTPIPGAACNDNNACTTNDACNASGQCVGTLIAVDDNNPCTNDSCDAATGLPVHTPTPGAACNDNNACTTNDVCNASGQCVGTLIAVDDSNACTSDSCDPATGLPAHTPIPGAACNDNNACTTNDACNASGQCVGTLIAVDDNNPCTNDSCDAATGLPVHTPTPGAACNDNNACTTNDVCNASGQCVGAPIAVDDNNPCTSDTCDPATGLTAHTPTPGAACNDNNACTTNDVCNASGQCVGTLIAVDDGNPCTSDTCDPATGLPAHTPTPGAACNDNDACTTNDSCNASGQCVGTLISVDDGNPCTSDTCDPATGLPVHTPTPGAACNDNNACTTNDLCNASGQCVGAPIAVDDNNPCTSDTCDPATGLPAHTPTPGAACNDNNACTSNDACNSSGQCVGTLIAVDDGNPCTSDTCDPATGLPAHTPTPGAACNDNNACTSNDACNSSGQCVGTLIAVDDGNPCTSDYCDPATGLPAHTPTPGAACNDNNACTTNDVCNASGQCVGTLIAVDDNNPCTSDSCDPATGLPAHTPTPGAACNDNNACTSNDACNSSGQCVGTLIAVDDGNPCTSDTCDPATGLPAHNPTPGAACNDNNACTSNDACNSSGQCVGTLIAVDDGNPCTSDSCDPATGLPAHTPTPGAACNDNNACTTNDACIASGQCVGTLIAVDDNNPCTGDSCDPATGLPVHAPLSGTSCDDGNKCNGISTCQAGVCTLTTSSVTCTNGNVCNDPGTCVPSTGLCSDPVPKSTGTSCDDGNSCNGISTCQAGVCTQTTAPVTCAEPDACHDAGVCNPMSGVCEYASKQCAPNVGADQALIEVNEGQTATVTGTYGDGNSTDNVTLTASVGTVVKTGIHQGTWTWTYATTDGPEESQTVTITADDGNNGTDTTTFQLVVNNVAPSVAVAGPLSIPEGTTQSFTFTIADPGADTGEIVGFSCGASGQPVGAPTLTQASGTTAAGGTFECWFADGPASSTVSITVEDSDGASSTPATYNVTVENRAPAVILSGAGTALEGELVEYTYAVTEYGNDTFALAAGYPKCGAHGMLVTSSVSASGGTFQCRFPAGPADSQVQVRVVDSDGANSNVSSITVAVGNIPPVVRLTGPVSASEGQVVTYQFEITDVPADSVQVSSLSCGSAGMLFVSSVLATSLGGTFDCLFLSGPATSTVSITVNDGAADSDAATLDVTIDDVAPTVSLTGATTVPEGSIQTYTFNATDPGGDMFVVNTPTFPDCGPFGSLVAGSLIENGSSGGSFQCFFADGPGTSTVRIQVIAGNRAGNEASLVVAVANVAPTVVLTGASTATPGETVTYHFTVGDPGNDTFTVPANPSCGASGTLVADSLVLGQTGGSFRCTFPAGPATTVVSVGVTDSDGAPSAPATQTVSISASPGADGRMTGGGSIRGASCGSRVTHGFEFHCDASKRPNHLTVAWGHGRHFFLEALTGASCSDNPSISAGQPVAAFDTLVATGIGRYNGVHGATVSVTFTDAGEPGHRDRAKIVVKNRRGHVVLSVDGLLDRGNHQAHGG